jgi:hypothetical protein
MHFIFGYQREVPVKIKTNLSKNTLVGLAFLIILLLIFLSFENLDPDTSIPPAIFEPSPSQDKQDQPTEVEEIEFEKNKIFPEVRTVWFTPKEKAELNFVSNQGGLK